MVVEERIELSVYRLSSECSAIELHYDMVTPGGFEPPFLDSKSRDLPLVDRVLSGTPGENRTHNP